MATQKQYESRVTDCGMFGRVSERALETVGQAADDEWDREVCRLELERRASL